ncbi:MAG: hypothetical protein AAFY88_08730, partial [Acidobacteriota bacterium]
MRTDPLGGRRSGNRRGLWSIAALGLVLGTCGVPPVDWGTSFESTVRSSVPILVERFFEARRGELTQAEARHGVTAWAAGSGRLGGGVDAGGAAGVQGAGEQEDDDVQTPDWLLENPTPSWVFASPGIFPFTKERPWTYGELGPLEVEALIEWGAEDGAPALAAAELAITWIAPELTGQEQARLWMMLGEAQSGWGRFRDATRHLETALRLMDRAGPNDFECGEVLLRYLTALFTRGHFDVMDKLLDRTTECWRRTGDPRGQSLTLNMRGLFHAARGEHALAQGAYREALDLVQVFDPHGYEGFLGPIERNLVKLKLAMGQFTEGVAVLDAHAARLSSGVLDVSASTSLGLVHNARAWAYERIGLAAVDRDDRADAFEEAEASYRKAFGLLAENDHNLAVLLENRAGFWTNAYGEERLSDALADLARARELHPGEGPQRALVELRLAGAYRRAGALDLADALLREAELGFERFQVRHGRLLASLERARIQREIAREPRRADDERLHARSEAVAEYTKARKFAEDQWSALGVGNWRRALQAAHAQIYSESVDFLLEEDRVEEAFGALEAGRARSLLEALASSADNRFVMALSVQLDSLVEERLRAERDGLEERVEALDLEIDGLYEEWEEREAIDFDQERESTYRPFGLAEVQRALDRDTTLLMYSLGRARSWVFVITRDDLRVVPRRG